MKHNLVTVLCAVGIACAAAPAALAQSNPPAAPAQKPMAAPAATAPAPASNKVTYSDQWRASKLIGLNVYNDQNEKLGDISEILLDKSGKVTGVVIGVVAFSDAGLSVQEPTSDTATVIAEKTTIRPAVCIVRSMARNGS